jgi:hypothetical protein
MLHVVRNRQKYFFRINVYLSLLHFIVLAYYFLLSISSKKCQIIWIKQYIWKNTYVSLILFIKKSVGQEYFIANLILHWNIWLVCMKKKIHKVIIDQIIKFNLYSNMLNDSANLFCDGYMAKEYDFALIPL